MTKKILVALDNSEISKELVRIADAWTQQTEVELFFLHVGRKDIKSEAKENQQLADFLRNMKISTGYQFQYRTGTSYLEILEQEKEIQPNLIIMGAHKHTMLGRLFLGSNTKYVLHHSACPVFIYKQQKLLFENKIVVPIDYTDINKPVIAMADECAQRMGAELYFIHVDESPKAPHFDAFGMSETSAADLRRQSEMLQVERKKIQKEIEQQESALKQFVALQNVQAKYQTIHKFGKPYLRILELQQYINAGMIMMAAHSHTYLNRLITGSNTDYLLHHAACSMYVYKEKKSANH